MGLSHQTYGLGSLATSLLSAFALASTSPEAVHAQTPPLPAPAGQAPLPRLEYSSEVRTNSEYLVGPKDVLKISVYRAPDLETTVQVATDGTIQMGAIGRIMVSDMPVAAVGRTIEQKLRASGIFLDPTVTVLVVEFRSRIASVLGAVARPGEYPIDRQNLTITELLARAGANFENGGAIISVVSGDGAGDSAEKFYVADLVAGRHERAVRPGESIFVQAPATFYISGEVQRAGAYPIEPGLTVGQAIAIAGGLTPRGSKSRVRVTHRNDNKQVGESVKARWEDAVKPNDLLVVGTRIF